MKIHTVRTLLASAAGGMGTYAATTHRPLAIFSALCLTASFVAALVYRPARDEAPR